MYIILVYDINEKRVAKMLKLCRQYLNWIQNSVFEGELTPAQLRELKFAASQIMNKEEDSLIIFTSRNEEWLKKEVIGKEKNDLDNII
jgi:CRISPR-associated protein Cas2